MTVTKHKSIISSMNQHTRTGRQPVLHWLQGGRGRGRRRPNGLRFRDWLPAPRDYVLPACINMSHRRALLHRHALHGHGDHNPGQSPAKHVERPLHGPFKMPLFLLAMLSAHLGGPLRVAFGACTACVKRLSVIGTQGSRTRLLAPSSWSSAGLR